MTNLPPVPPIPNGLPAIPRSLAPDEPGEARESAPPVPERESPPPVRDAGAPLDPPAPVAERGASGASAARASDSVRGPQSAVPSAASTRPAGPPRAVVATAKPPRAPKPPKRASTPAPPPPGDRHPGRALAIAAVVLGALAVVGAFVPFVNYGSWFVGVAGMALGVIALLRRSRGRGLAVGGIILSGIGFLLSVILAAVYTIGFITAWGAGTPGDPGTSATAPEVATETIPAVYGQTVAYDDGLQLQVSAPTTFDPSPDARGADQSWNLSFTITIYNGSAADVALDPTLGVFSNGAAGSPIVDPQSGLDGAVPRGTIGAGQTLSWVIGSSVANPADVTVQITPAGAYLTSNFTN